MKKEGITVATPVQREIIPAIMEGRDVIAQSETGSGKTLSFAVPLLEQIKPKDGLQALVLVPTRELCIQVAGEFRKFAPGKDFRPLAIYGGASISEQIRRIKKANAAVATPGRLLDIIERKAIDLSTIKYLVLDEADRMLDMGFIRDIERILKHMPQKKQTMLFSATMNTEIEKLSAKYLHDPFTIELKKHVEPGYLNQTYYIVSKDDKPALLIDLLKNERDLTIVFCNRKHITEKLAKLLTNKGIPSKCLHGDMTQAKRESVTKDFRDKKIRVLIATDVASRGLHIEGISHVYNYEIPKEAESYTHRVGRTARAGNKGEAISLVMPGEDEKFFKQILFMYKGVIKLIEADKAMLAEARKSNTDSKLQHTRKPQEGKKHHVKEQPHDSKRHHAGSQRPHKEQHQSRGGQQRRKHEDTSTRQDRFENTGQKARKNEGRSSGHVSKSQKPAQGERRNNKSQQYGSFRRNAGDDSRRGYGRGSYPQRNYPVPQDKRNKGKGRFSGETPEEKKIVTKESAQEKNYLDYMKRFDESLRDKEEEKPKKKFQFRDIFKRRKK
ncbi:MAG: DEAD/DEAH box helicase [Ignavibacteria bacterium]|nr:DEAD/DEAH box helicase [Ignavibacteria bacterium]